MIRLSRKNVWRSTAAPNSLKSYSICHFAKKDWRLLVLVSIVMIRALFNNHQKVGGIFSIIWHTPDTKTIAPFFWPRHDHEKRGETTRESPWRALSTSSRHQ